MDMLERRIREAFAALLSTSARVLQRTAGELAQAASELRQDDGREDAERTWDESPAEETSTMVGGAPLRAVPDAPTDDRIVELSTGTVSQIRAQLEELSPDELRRLKEIELANRRRTTLIAAIDRALAGSAP